MRAHYNHLDPFLSTEDADSMLRLAENFGSFGPYANEAACLMNGVFPSPLACHGSANPKAAHLLSTLKAQTARARPFNLTIIQPL